MSSHIYDEAAVKEIAYAEATPAEDKGIVLEGKMTIGEKKKTRAHKLVGDTTQIMELEDGGMRNRVKMIKTNTPPEYKRTSTRPKINE